MLFLLYVNDLPEVAENSDIAMFADDSKCFKSITSVHDCFDLQSDLNKICCWSRENELDFQPKKCEIMKVTRKRQGFDRSYYINWNEKLKCVSSQVDLGVSISCDLSWNSHIDQITASENRMLGFLKRNCSKFMSCNALKSLYIAIVRPRFGYCSQLWAPQSVIRNIFLLESVQRRSTKFICGYTEVNYRDRLVQLKLLPVSYWLEYLDLIFFFKCKVGIYTIDLSNYLTFCAGVTRRLSSGLYLRQNCIPKTSSFRDSYFIRIVNIWNALPINIKASSSLTEFRVKLKEFFFERLRSVFDGDNIRSYKIICPKCRSVNTMNLCTC